MFSPQHSVQTPAVGTDTQVHMLLHTRTHTISPRWPTCWCMPNTDLTVTSQGGSAMAEMDDLKEKKLSASAATSWIICCGLITSHLTHQGIVVFNCVFISVSGRAAISCCTLALQYKHGGVSQQCVGRHGDVTHIPAWWALTVWTVRFTVGIGMSQSTFWLLFRPNRERVKVEERARVGRFKQMCRMWKMGQKWGVHCGKERGK